MARVEINVVAWARQARLGVENARDWLDHLAETLHDVLPEANEVQRQAASRQLEMVLMHLGWAHQDLTTIMERGDADNDKPAF